MPPRSTPPDLQERLRAVQARPPNQRCFDCGAPSPTWASVRLGILLCMNCAGRHRGYGTSVSFIRSVTLDCWSAAQIALMEAGGNDAFLAYCSSHRIPRPVAYETAPLDAYREELLARAEGVARGEGAGASADALAGVSAGTYANEDDCAHGGRGPGSGSLDLAPGDPNPALGDPECPPGRQRYGREEPPVHTGPQATVDQGLSHSNPDSSDSDESRPSRRSRVSSVGSGVSARGATLRTGRRSLGTVKRRG